MLITVAGCWLLLKEDDRSGKMMNVGLYDVRKNRCRDYVLHNGMVMGGLLG